MKNKTFEKAYLEYLEYAKLKQKPTSILSFKRQMEKNVIPYFGNKKIKKINALEYTRWQTKMQEKKLKYIYRRNLHYNMCAIYKYLENYYNIKNIPRIVGNFKDDYEIEEEKEIWDINEYNKFIQSVDDKIYYTLFKMLFFTGCRKGELLALTFKDIEENEVNIYKSISKDVFNGERIIIKPKTKKSIRKILIDYETIKNINELKEYYKAKFENFNNNFYIFGGNKAISYTTLQRKFEFYIKKSKVKRIRIHDFRHSHASMLYQNNIPVETISKRLGHSSIKTTLDTYIHTYDKNEKKVVELLSSLN